MECFVKMVNGLSKFSILDVWQVLDTPVYTNKEKKNLSLLKTLKTPNFKRQNETKTEKDHI